MKRHRGSIEVESEPGAGTAVRVLLPAAPEPLAAPGAAAEPQQALGGRVLVVDDEPFVREVAKEALESVGYRVEVAASGSEAIALYAAARESGHPFDVLVLDLTIPGDLGGVATLERLRRSDPGVRAIASSGYSTDAVMAYPAAHGFRGAVTKPYTIDELVQAVAHAQRD